jgi:hypothetical protein
MYEMIVIEKFDFRDGTTVFVGPVTGDTSRIPPCYCELVINGEKKKSIWIEGERLIEKRKNNSYRVVSTVDKLPDDISFVCGQWMLRMCP